MGGGCVLVYDCERVSSNLIVEGDETRLAEIDARMGSTRKPETSRSADVVALMWFRHFRAMRLCGTSCDAQNGPHSGPQQCGGAFFADALRRPEFSASRIGRDKYPAERLTESVVYRFRRS